MHTEPTPEHHWLQQLVGEWAYESTCTIGPDAQAVTTRGRETVRAIGGLWVVGELTGTMPDGAPMTGLITLGYDPARAAFVGTWIGSPMAFMFTYTGQLEGDTLTLSTPGPSFDDPAVITEYRDVVRVAGPGERWMVSQHRGPDGSWTDFMRAHYTRAR